MQHTVVFRGFIGGGKVKVLEEEHVFEEELMAGVLRELAERHALTMSFFEDHMMEIEFMDEPDPKQRFLRFGTDPTGMVDPQVLDLDKLMRPPD